jgi:hypothetical protein
MCPRINGEFRSCVQANAKSMGSNRSTFAVKTNAHASNLAKFPPNGIESVWFSQTAPRLKPIS